MNCILASTKKECNPDCAYCVFVDEHAHTTYENQVKKLQKLKTMLVKRLLCVEKQLLNPIQKGGDTHAGI